MITDLSSNTLGATAGSSSSASAGGRGWTERSEGSPGAHGLTIHLEPWSESALTEWRGLERRIDDVPLAASSPWTAAWLDAYGETVNARVAIAESAGKTCGMALVCRSDAERAGPWRLRTTHFGTAGEPASESACVEYNGLLVEDSHRAAFASQLIALARADRSVDEIRLDGFDDATAAGFLDQLPGAETVRRASRYCNLQSIREHRESVMDSLGGSTRSSLRRALRKSGDVQLQQAASLYEADDFLTELIELHQARWRAVGQPGAFASARFTRFQRELVTRLVPEERVVLVRIRNSSLTIGVLMLLVDRGRLLDYLSGFASFDQTPSPGIVTHYLAMEYALARGYGAYDFLVGDKRHKTNLATDSRDLVWATWRQPSWKNRTIAALLQLKRTVADLRQPRVVAPESAATEETGQ